MNKDSKKYNKFIYKAYEFNKNSKTLNLYYSFDDKIELKETYVFDFEFIDYDPEILNRALENLFFVAGVSYYKMYIPQHIEVRQGIIDDLTANFLSRTFEKGLGEFWYVNKLDPKSQVNFPVTGTISQTSTRDNGSLLIGVGGGKDSLVSIELLRSAGQDITTWSLNHKPQLKPLVDEIGLPHLWVERKWDAKIQQLNKEDALNGHVPISAIFACAGVVTAILAGKHDVVVSNEYSANEPTLTYQGVEINHQYSKTQEFENNYQELLKHNFGSSIRYYSALRPFSEVRIAEIFSKLAFEKYKHLFSSCNRAFRLTSDSMSWCGECSKCAFVYLALSPFIINDELQATFNGEDLLSKPSLQSIYEQLLGISSNKPLECVGEVKESRAAMSLAQKSNQELFKYNFEMPADYDFRDTRPSSMPKEIENIILSESSRY